MRQVTLLDRSEMRAALRHQLEMDPARTAVILVDAHRGHLDPAVATMPVAREDVQRVREALTRLVHGARELGVMVVHVVMIHRCVPYPGAESMANPFWRAVEAARQSLTPDRPSTISRHNLEGSPQTEILPELGPEPTDYVIRSKKRLSAFYGTDLEILLRIHRIETVILAGINTNTCVLCTAFDAFNRDLRVVVAEDAVASMYGDDLHIFGLENVARCLGWILPVDEILNHLRTRTAVSDAGS
ncbi:MAG: cysteine hydrolase [Anaerolineae bacterium]|nr:cysteine hydrolase [Anaerolineae bacterium]